MSYDTLLLHVYGYHVGADHAIQNLMSEVNEAKKYKMWDSFNRNFCFREVLTESDLKTVSIAVDDLHQNGVISHDTYRILVDQIAEYPPYDVVMTGDELMQKASEWLTDLQMQVISMWARMDGLPKLTVKNMADRLGISVYAVNLNVKQALDVLRSIAKNEEPRIAPRKAMSAVATQKGIDRALKTLQRAGYDVSAIVPPNRETPS